MSFYLFVQAINLFNLEKSKVVFIVDCWYVN